MARNGAFGCQRCDAYHAQDLKIIGNVSARLCKDCDNDWRDRCEVLPEYLRLLDVSLRGRCVSAAAQGVRDAYDEVKPLQDECDALLAGPIRAAATAFAAESITREVDVAK